MDIKQLILKLPFLFIIIAFTNILLFSLRKILPKIIMITSETFIYFLISLLILSSLILMVFQFLYILKNTKLRTLYLFVSIGVFCDYFFNDNLKFFSGLLISDTYDLIVIFLFVYSVVLLVSFVFYKKNNKNILLDEDNEMAIKSIDQDELGVYPFVSHLAKSINKNLNKTTTIGLYGEWGSGKSSIINLLDIEFKDKYSNNFSVFNFMPIHLKNENSDVITRFLYEFSYFINKESMDKELAKQIERYARLLNSVTLKFGVFSFNFKEMSLFEDTQLLEQKELIANLIKEKKKSYLIIIDEIDRLEHEEIRNILKLVRFIGDFPKTTYLLSFEERIVTNVIKKYYYDIDISKNDLLEKFIQIPIYIPQTDLTSLKSMCNKRFTRIFNSNKLDLSELEELVDLVISLKMTPRNIKRLCNLADYLLPLLKNEVNEIELIKLLIIKIESPKLYDYIRNNPNLFLLDQSDLKKEERTNFLKDYMQFYQLLSELFPLLNKTSGNEEDIIEYYSDLEKRVSSSKFFAQFFMYGVPSDLISQHDIENFLENLYENSINSKTIDSYTNLLSNGDVDNINHLINIKVRMNRENKKLNLKYFLLQVEMFDYCYNTKKENILGIVFNNTTFIVENHLITDTELFNNLKSASIKYVYSLLKRVGEKNSNKKYEFETIREILLDNIEENLIGIEKKYSEQDTYLFIKFWRINSKNVKEKLSNFIKLGVLDYKGMLNLLYDESILKEGNGEYLVDWYYLVISILPSKVIDEFLTNFNDDNGVVFFRKANSKIYSHILSNLTLALIKGEKEKVRVPENQKFKEILEFNIKDINIKDIHKELEKIKRHNNLIDNK